MTNQTHNRAAELGETPAGGFGRAHKETPMNEDLKAGFALRAEGIEANLAANTRAHRNHADRVERAIAALTRTGRPFTALDLEALILSDGEGEFPNNLMSSYIGSWARLGRIVRLTDRPPVRAIRPARRGGFCWYWRGVDSNVDNSSAPGSEAA